jgi:hypothetical protein
MAMRQLRGSASERRLLLLFVLGALLAVGASARTATSAADGAAATPPCALATANQLVEQHRLNSFLLDNPVRQLLCGPFMGPGTEAMAVTIGAPTCWPVQSWAILGFRSGSWQLLKEIPAYLIPPLTAVGNDIREETAVQRPGDSRCLPTGGTHARLWHWNGTEFVAGPWKQVKPGAALTRAAFRSPTGNIECGMVDEGRSTLVDCWTFRPPQRAKLYPGGRLTICRGQARCNIGNIGEEEPTLAYGKHQTVGRFRCVSRFTGMTCTETRSGKGFLLSRSGVSRIG